MAAKKKTPARKAPATKTKGASRRASAPKKRVVRRTRRPDAKVKRRAGGARTPAGPKENPEALALARDIAKVALEKKATDVTIIDTRRRGPSVGYDYIVLATGESERQLSAISEGLREALKPRGYRGSVEASPDWVLVHYDDVVAHFFTPDKRRLYDIEGLWSDAPRVAVRR